MKFTLFSVNYSIKLSLFILIIITSSFYFSPIARINGLPTTDVFPTIDGSWNSTEFPVVNTVITEDGKLVMEYGIRVNLTHFFIGVRYQDDDPKIFSSDPFIPRDYLAIGFDRNMDGIFMGTSSNPDDTMFIGMEGNESEDLFMQGIRVGGGSVVKDETNSLGTDDTYGRFSLNENTFSFEAVKLLDSGDDAGNDIAYEYGQRIKIMLAHWDNLPVLTEITSYTEFLNVRLLDTSDPEYYPTLSIDDIRIGVLILVIAIIFTGYYFISRKKII
ncbi:MAG: hypothetical protein ACW981_12370 [Candidatus Hodarchaeales archaeon]|jgi:hypothetical protein